ncbi:MAG: hypothetical protein DYG87_07180 [Anaerolineae bacterium CFX3]|nr:hypothetical protein [Anaerolineae bacterium CFX3]
MQCTFSITNGIDDVSGFSFSFQIFSCKLQIIKRRALRIEFQAIEWVFDHKVVFSQNLGGNMFYTRHLYGFYNAEEI